MRLRTLARLEQTLRDNGWHPMSDVWLQLAARARTGIRVGGVSGGRRAGKSTAILRFLLSDMIAAIESSDRFEVGYRAPKLNEPRDLDLIELASGDDSEGPYLRVSPGDVGTFAVVSARKEQAASRLDTVDDMLEVIGIDRKKRFMHISLDHYPYEWRVYTANKDSVVSMTCAGALCDEMARWRDSSDGQNHGLEVVRSLRPSMATMPEAMLWVASSPWVEGDLHQTMLGALGRPSIPTPADTISAVIPTWVGNPTITREQTMLEESDEMVWEREFAAIPMPRDSMDWFRMEDIERACA